MNEKSFKSTNEEEQINEEEEEEFKEENYRLGGRPPLTTLLVLAIGPLISQTVSAFYGIIDSMWVAYAIGNMGMSAVSLYTNLDNIGRAFGFFLNTSASSKISGLFGEKKGEEASQVISDLYRVCLICGFIVPLIIIPSATPLAKWFGADDLIISMGLDYLKPLMYSSFITCMYLLGCGCLQAEGRTFLVGVAQISSFLLNGGLFDPLFLLYFKWGTKGAAYATVLAEAIPAFILMILYYTGHFGVKPKWNGLFKPFSPHSYEAMKIGISQFFANISHSVPGIIIRKYIGMCSINNGQNNFNEAMAGFNAVIRFFGIVNAVRMSSSMALLPTASYSFTSKRYDRLFLLLIHASWINFVWGLLTTLSLIIFPTIIVKTISSDPIFLFWAVPMVRNAGWDPILSWCRVISQTMLQSMKLGQKATFYSIFATLFVQLIVSTILFFTNKYDFVRMMYTYPISSLIAMIVGISIVFFPLYKLYTDYFLDQTPLENEKIQIEELD